MKNSKSEFMGTDENGHSEGLPTSKTTANISKPDTILEDDSKKN